MYPYPPQPPYPYPQPQPPQQKRYAVPIITIVSVAVTCVLLVCCLGLALLNTLHPAAATAAATPTQNTSSTFPATVFSTSAPSLPPTIHAIHAIHAPTLGGTTDDFLATYAVVAGSHGLDYTATIAGQPVLIALSLADASHSPDGLAHIAIVDVQPPADALASASWSATIAATIATTFLPADAHPQRTTTSSAGVTVHFYTSPAMAVTFNADQFTNDAGSLRVAPGTINYVCQRLVATLPGLDDCLITIGSA